MVAAVVRVAVAVEAAVAVRVCAAAAAVTAVALATEIKKKELLCQIIQYDVHFQMYPNL